MGRTLTCIVCSGVMDNLDERGNQPSEGLAFASSGHYGSTVFDPMDGTFLELNICDECLKANADIIKLGQPTGTPRAKYKRWQP